MTITVTLKGISKNGPKQEAIAKLACELAQKAINHPDFRPMIESMSYRETRFRKAEGSWFSVPVNEIYNYIKSGRERGTPSDSEIDIEVKLWKFRRSGTVGSTTPGKLPFKTSFWFINKCIAKNDPTSLAAHFIHEWLHVSGFYHHPNNKARKDVAYNVSNAVKSILNGKSDLIDDLDPESLDHDLEFGECGCGCGHHEEPQELSAEDKAELIQ